MNIVGGGSSTGGSSYTLVMHKGHILDRPEAAHEKVARLIAQGKRGWWLVLGSHTNPLWSWPVYAEIK